MGRLEGIAKPVMDDMNNIDHIFSVKMFSDFWMYHPWIFFMKLSVALALNLPACRALGPRFLDSQCFVLELAGTGACSRCGTSKKSGKSSCCSPGGDWFGDCGEDDDDSFRHTWAEGIVACQSTFMTVNEHASKLCFDKSYQEFYSG